MNAAILLEHFDRISDAPDAVPHMRQFILELAVRGKIVDQLPGDEPASVLLKHIRTERNRRIATGQMKDSVYEPVRADEEWFEIPKTWCWVRLGEIAHILMGQSPPGDTYNKSGEGLPLINGPVEFTEGPFGRTVVNQYTTAPTNICEEGDLLLCVRGSTTGRTNIAAFKACIGRGVAAIRPLYADQYVRLFIWRLRASIIAMGRGIAFPSVSRQQIADLVVPLPPLQEQHRIVAKVDELMALCDRLDEARNEREVVRTRVTVTSLRKLSVDTEGIDATSSARLYIDHIQPLTTRADQIAKLRQAVLSLAVSGRLTRQDSRDESAAEQLEQIRAERRTMSKDGRLRKEKVSSPVSPSDWPFTIPDSWLWVRIGDATLFTEYGTSFKSEHFTEGIPVLKMGDIQNGSVILGGQKVVPTSIEDLPALYLKKFDLLYNRTNSPELVGKTGIYLGDDNEYTFASYLIRIRCSRAHSEPLYINLAMNAPFFRVTQIMPLLKQQCGQANVNGTALQQMIIPLPPLAEQRRIVAKVEQLMAICDRLERQIKDSMTCSSALLKAVLHHALRGNSSDERHFIETFPRIAAEA